MVSVYYTLINSKSFSLSFFFGLNAKTQLKIIKWKENRRLLLSDFIVEFVYLH